MKKILMITVLILFSIGAVNAGLDDVFCLVNKDKVVISLKQTTGYYMCKDTIASLDHLMMQTTNDLNKIDGYIKKHRNLGYRIGLKEEKTTLLNQFQLMKNNIIINIQKFETSIFQKSVRYFIIKITPYKIRLQKSLVKVDALTASGYATPELNSYAMLLKAQVAIIGSFSTISNVEQLTELLKNYVYLKKEIEGRSE